jgi:hypothetical protein
MWAGRERAKRACFQLVRRLVPLRAALPEAAWQGEAPMREGTTPLVPTQKEALWGAPQVRAPQVRAPLPVGALPVAPLLVVPPVRGTLLLVATRQVATRQVATRQAPPRVPQEPVRAAPLLAAVAPPRAWQRRRRLRTAAQEPWAQWAARRPQAAQPALLREEEPLQEEMQRREEAPQ